MASSLEGMAASLARCGEATDAVRLYGAAATVRQRIGAPMAVVERAAHEAGLHAVAARLMETDFAKAWDFGILQDVTEAVDTALEIRWPGPDRPR